MMPDQRAVGAMIVNGPGSFNSVPEFAVRNRETI
jgi:hypothetical protein